MPQLNAPESAGSAYFCWADDEMELVFFTEKPDGDSLQFQAPNGDTVFMTVREIP